MSDLILEVQKREPGSKNVNRRLRASGIVPAVVYGGAREPVAIQVGHRKVEELMRSTGTEHSVFLLKLEGTDKSRHTMIRELVTDSMTGQMIHIDFQRIDMDSAVRVEIPVEVHGIAYGVKTDGGLLDFVTRQVEVECLPNKIPAHLDLDVTELHVGDHVEASALELPEGVELVSEPTQVIVSIKGKPLAELGVDEDAEDLLTAEAAEPEVIGQDGE